MREIPTVEEPDELRRAYGEFKRAYWESLRADLGVCQMLMPPIQELSFLADGLSGMDQLICMEFALLSAEHKAKFGEEISMMMARPSRGTNEKIRECLSTGKPYDYYAGGIPKDELF